MAPLPDPKLPGSAWAQPGVPNALTPPPMSSGQRQRYVPQHFDAQGRFVPPHYEPAAKPPQFRGHFRKDELARQTARQRGYKEPAPNYAPPPDLPEKRPEGR